MFKLCFTSLSLFWAYYAGFYFKDNYKYLAGENIGLIGDIISISTGIIVIIFIGLVIAGIGYRITEFLDKVK